MVTASGLEVALNVKLSLEEHVRREFPTTPENEWPASLVVLVFPRLLEIRLYPIAGRQTMLNSKKGCLCAPVELAKTIEELIER